jgi:sec-independent protein translocase protein TatA
MMGDVAKGLKSFKQGLSDDDKPADQQTRQLPPQQVQPQQPIDITPQPTRPAEPAPPPADDQSRS